MKIPKQRFNIGIFFLCFNITHLSYKKRYKVLGVQSFRGGLEIEAICVCKINDVHQPQASHDLWAVGSQVSQSVSQSSQVSHVNNAAENARV